MIDNLDANLELDGDRSNLLLKEIKGEAKVKIKYSEVEIYPINQTIFKQFDAKFSPINIYLNQALPMR